jgi:hypothetical protein
MDTRQEKLQREAKKLAKAKKEENDALRKIIQAMTKNVTKEDKPCK